jgi:hypothetical protein
LPECSVKDGIAGGVGKVGQDDRV